MKHQTPNRTAPDRSPVNKHGAETRRTPGDPGDKVPSGVQKQAKGQGESQKAREKTSPAQGQQSAQVKGNTISFLSSSIREEVLDKIKGCTHCASDEDLANVPRPKWILKPYAAKGAITLLQGLQKAAGKTTFVLHAVNNTLHGRSFLGQPCDPTPVLYLTEQNASTFLPKLKEVGLLGHPNFHFIYWHDVGTLPWHELIYCIVYLCQQWNIGLLVIDTFAHFAGLSGDDENNAGSILTALKPLLDATSTGLSIILVHHERKAGGEMWNAGRGSGAIQGACDIVVSLRRTGGNTRSSLRQIQAIGRLPDIPEELIVELTEDGYVSHGTTTDVAAQEATELALQVAPSKEEDALTADAMLKAAGIFGIGTKKSTFRAKLKALVEDGKLKSVGRGVKGDPLRYYKAD